MMTAAPPRYAIVWGKGRAMVTVTFRNNLKQYAERREKRSRGS